MIKNLLLILKLIAAFILLQTLYFKFSASKESVELFTKLVGAKNEAYMRIGTGVLELITSILLLIPKTTYLGSALGIGIMAGAIFSHLTIIGVESQGDGGQLFLYAVTVFVICIIISLSNFKKYIQLFNCIFKKQCCNNNGEKK